MTQFSTHNTSIGRSLKLSFSLKKKKCNHTRRHIRKSGRPKRGKKANIYRCESNVEFALQRIFCFIKCCNKMSKFMYSWVCSKESPSIVSVTKDSVMSFHIFIQRKNGRTGKLIKFKSIPFDKRKKGWWNIQRDVDKYLMMTSFRFKFFMFSFLYPLKCANETEMVC